jgi:hypothetical protein
MVTGATVHKADYIGYSVVFIKRQFTEVIHLVFLHSVGILCAWLPFLGSLFTQFDWSVFPLCLLPAWLVVVTTETFPFACSAYSYYICILSNVRSLQIEGWLEFNINVFYFNVRCSTLLHPPPLGFQCVGVCLVPISVCPEMKLHSLVISKTEL